LQQAAKALGREIVVVRASSEGDFASVFDGIAHARAGALFISPDPFLNSRSQQLATLTLHHGLPAIFHVREFATAGGLMSYGGSNSDAYRQVGVYAGRILKGEKPAELPVHRSTKAELVLNLKTARALRLNIPLPLLGRADEVIE
jgi:putative ABC transport system substrate-binding protein